MTEIFAVEESESDFVKHVSRSQFGSGFVPLGNHHYISKQNLAVLCEAGSKVKSEQQNPQLLTCGERKLSTVQSNGLSVCVHSFNYLDAVIGASQPKIGVIKQLSKNYECLFMDLRLS